MVPETKPEWDRSELNSTPAYRSSIQKLDNVGDEAVLVYDGACF